MLLDVYLQGLGGYTFSTDVPRAAAAKDKILVNPEYWKRLNKKERSFLLDHEVLHIILKHHSRFDKKNDRRELANKACDLSINSILKDQYIAEGEDVAKVLPTLYQDGMFPCKYGLEELRGADYYLEMLKKNVSTGASAAAAAKNMQNGPAGSEELEQKLQADGGFSLDGTSLSNNVKLEMRQGKQSFESYMKELFGTTTMWSGYSTEERFSKRRRGIPGVLLPQEMYTETQSKVRKNKIGLFLDFSGSCESIKPVFEGAVPLIPQRFFVVDTFKFATFLAPYHSDKYVGGGTNFNSIAAYDGKYDQIWIFSDGLGSVPTFTKTKNVVWFLGGEACSTSYIPKPQKHCLLSNFVRFKDEDAQYSF